MTQITIEPLTKRELDILSALVDGLSNSEIANRYHIASKTVKWYNSQIYSKLGVSGRQEASELAQQLNLLETAPDISTVPHNLPRDLTPFIGRESDINELVNMMQGDSRLVTIVAPGGMGKTRLCIEAGRTLKSQFYDGVFIIQFAPVQNPEAILPTIARVFELENYLEQDETPLETLSRYLEQQKVLLILDNMEHLLDGIHVIAELIQRTQHLNFLITSRERLNLRGEQVYSLKGMEFPGGLHEDATQFSSVQLFLQSAQRTRPDFTLTQANIPAIIQICQLVGGMPLGLELAAGWVDVLSVENIATEIEKNLEILQTEMRDAPTRQRSITASLNQTWERLSDHEQEFMMYMSVFHGGFIPEAAGSIPGIDLRTLRKLNNRALLYQSADNRYEFQELVRQYCEQKLMDSGLYDDAIQRFYQFFMDDIFTLRFYEFDPAYPDLALIPELNNIRVLFDRLLQQGDLEHFFAIPVVVWIALLSRSTQSEMQSLIASARVALEKYPQSPELWTIILDTYTAHMTATFVSHQPAIPIFKDVLNRLDPYPSTSLHCLTWTCLARVESAVSFTIHSVESSDPFTFPDEVIARYYFALELARNIGDKHQQHTTLMFLGTGSALYNRVDEAHNALIQLQALRPPGQSKPPVGELHISALIAGAEKRFDDMEQIALEIIEFFKSHGDIPATANVLTHLSRMWIEEGQPERATPYVKEALILHRDFALDWQVLGNLWGTFATNYLLLLGEYRYATEIYAFVEHHPLSSDKFRNQVRDFMLVCQQNLDPEAFKSAYNYGKNMKFNQVVEDALAYLSAAD